MDVHVYSIHCGIQFKVCVRVSHRVEAVWAQFLCGHRVTVAARRTTVTVMATPTASTHCPLAVRLSMAMCRGTAKPAPPHSLPPTAVATSTRNRL